MDPNGQASSVSLLKFLTQQMDLLVTVQKEQKEELVKLVEVQMEQTGLLQKLIEGQNGVKSILSSQQSQSHDAEIIMNHDSPVITELNTKVSSFIDFMRAEHLGPHHIIIAVLKYVLGVM